VINGAKPDGSLNLGMLRKRQRKRLSRGEEKRRKRQREKRTESGKRG
jgi:hypothetical protein